MPNKSINMTIFGKPIAQARPRFYRRGKHVGTYNPQETEAGRFALEIRSQLPAGWEPLSGPVQLGCIFGMPIPKSSSLKMAEAMLAGEIMHTKKPDLDNLVKFVKDAARGLFWVDDSQVVRVLAWKVYSDTPHTELTVRGAIRKAQG